MGHGKIINSLIRLFLCFCMINTMVMPSYSQTLNLPQPGTMAQLSASYTPVLLKGVQINIKNPFEFNFIIGQSDDAWLEGQFRQEADKLIKYFLATLTTPEKDMWVNLSPYEKDRIIPEAFGSTDMGRDMLAQDYLLKQITATLLYPEEELGRKFWDKVYEKAFERYGTSEIPMDSFHKVWIVPDVAQVYENGDRAFITQSRLKVLLEEDYLAISKSSSQENGRAESSRNDMGTEIMRSIIIPELEREVNEGAHFASLRQLYSSLILATWYKKKLRQSILSEVYVDQNKIVGIERSNVLTAKSEDSTESRDDVDVIYDQYVEAFQKGVFNYIKEEEGLLTQDVILRHYFSGGVDIRRFSSESMTLDGQAKDVNLDDAMIVNALIDPISDEKEARQRRVYEAYLGELSADDREAILWQRLEVNHAREVPSKEKYRQVASALAHLGRAAGNWWRFSQLLPFITPQNMSRALEQELIMYINQGSVGNRDLYNGFYSFDVELARLNALLRYAKKNSNFNPLADRLLKLLELSKMDSRVESLLFEFMGSIDQQEKERLNVILSSSFSLYYPSYEYDGEKRRSHNLMIGLVLRLRLFMDPKYSLRQRFETPPLKDGDLEVLLNVDTEEAWALIVEGYAARALVEENNIGKKDAYAIAIREAGRQQQALEYIRREYTPYKKGSPKFITQNVYRIASLDTEAAYDFVLDMLSENTIHSGDLEFFRAMVDLKEGLSFSRYANAYGNNMTGQYALQFRDALSTRLTEGQQMRLRSVIANLPQLNIPVAFLPEMFPEIGRVGDVIPISSEMSIEIWRPRRTENSIKVVDRLKELMDSSGIEGDERMRWEDLEEELNSEYNRTYLFRNAEGEIVAFGIVSIPNKPWESFGGIMVSDEGRYQHLGRRMLNKSLEDYKTLGRKIFRFVAADSTNVSKYYELYGRRILRRGYSLVIEKRLSEGAFFNYVDIFFPGTDQDGFTDIVKLAHERTDAAGGDAAMVGSDSREYQLKKHTFWVESSLNKLLGRLMDTAAYVRARSANELAILAEGKLITAASIPKVVDGLLGGLMDRDTEVRTGSAEGLAILAQGKLITAESIPKVVDGLLGGLMDADVYVRTRSEKGVAILAQGKLITAESIPQEKLGRLLGELMNSDANVRRRSAKALVILAEGKLITAESIPKVVDGLLGGLMDTDTYVRTKSAEGLMLLAQGKLIPAESIPKVVDGLLGGLMDSDADVRTKSAEGLVILAQGKLITAESIPQEKLDGLLWGLMDIDSYVRTRSAEGLVILADGKLIPAESIPQEKLDGLLGGLMDGNAIVFKRSAEGLAILAQGKLITAESIPQEKLDGLLGGLMDSYTDRRKRSAEGLAILAQGKLITAESIPQEKLGGLLGGLMDTDADVRTKSAEGLKILNTMFGEPIIDVFDASDKNILFMKNIHHLLLESFVDVLKNGQVSSSIFHNRLDYLTDYMIEGKYELDSELRNKISDAVAYAYPNVGGHLDTMIRFLEQQNILTNQETNRIVGAFGAWGINEGGDLPQGSRGYVQYRAFGFSGQGVELGGGQLLGPQVKFEWHYPKQRNDQGGYQQEAPQGRFGYRRMRMSDDKGNAQEMIGFLGRQLDSSDKKETGIYDLREDNGDVEATVLKEGYHKAKHYQIYRLGDDETLRKRQVMRMTRKDGSFYHIAPLGYDKNLTFAYYQIVESGAVFKACIDASHLKQMLNEEKVRFKDDFDYHELSFASERAWRFISKVKKSLKEIQQESIKADEQSVSDAYYVDSEEEYDRLVSDMKNMIGYLINEGFIQEHLGGNPLDGVELENLSRDEVLEWSAFIIEAFEKVNKLDLLSPFLPENMIVKGYVLGRLNNARLNASQLREYLGTMVSILNDEMGTNYNLDDVAEEDRLKQSVKILSTFDKYVQQARMLGDLSKVLSYNPVSAVEMALESLTIGNATHRVGGVDSSWEEVRHYPVFEILENVSKPGIKPVVESQGVYGYVEIDENLRDQDIQVQEKRTQIYLKGRSIVMTQGVTMREALEGVGLSLDDDRYNVLFEGGVDERLNERFVIKIEAVGVGENDRAMKTDKVGGIDFDANKFDLQVENDGAMSTFEFDVEAIRNMQIDGFRPVIIDITPVRNIPALLGLNDDERDGDEPIQISLSQYFIKSDQDIFV